MLRVLYFKNNYDNDSYSRYNLFTNLNFLYCLKNHHKKNRNTLLRKWDKKYNIKRSKSSVILLFSLVIIPNIKIINNSTNIIASINVVVFFILYFQYVNNSREIFSIALNNKKSFNNSNTQYHINYVSLLGFF